MSIFSKVKDNLWTGQRQCFLGYNLAYLESVVQRFRLQSELWISAEVQMRPKFHNKNGTQSRWGQYKKIIWNAA